MTTKTLRAGVTLATLMLAAPAWAGDGSAEEVEAAKAEATAAKAEAAAAKAEAGAAKAEAAAAKAEAAADKVIADCPPGAFCEETTVAPPPREVVVDPEDVDKPAVSSKKRGTTVVLPPAQDPTQPRTFTYHPDPDGGPGQVIIWEDGDGPPRVATKLESKGEKRAKRRRMGRHRRWGMNLRVNGIILPRFDPDADSDAGMAGLGLSLRYRPTPMFAIDLSSDFVGGVDTNGNDRQEVPLAASAMLYANPRSLAQFYLFGGINWSFARVFSDDIEPNLAEGNADEYTYIGGHAGLGLEFRVSKLVGLNVDGLAMVRTRTDDDGDGRFPEFYNPRTKEASNTSAAGALRAGVTFWW